MIVRDPCKRFDDLIDIAAVSDANRGSDSVSRRRTARFIDDLAVTNNTVGNRNLDIIARQNSRAAQADVRDHAPFTGFQNNEVAILVRGIGDDRYAGKQIGQRVFCCETQRKTDDTGRCHPGGYIDVPCKKDEIDCQRDQQYLQDSTDERQHARMQHASHPASPDGCEDERKQATKKAVPDEYRDRPEYTERNVLRRGGHPQAVRCHRQANQNKRNENRPVKQGDQLIIEFRLRPGDKLGNRLAQDEVRDLAEQDESHGDRRGLQIDIRADKLSPGLHLIDEVVQRFTTCVSGFAGLDQNSWS